MTDASCLPHKNRGFDDVAATRIVSGVPMCRDCTEGKPVENESRFSNPSIHVRGDEQEVKTQPPGTIGSSWRGSGKKTPPVFAEAHVKDKKAIDFIAMQNDRSDGMKVSVIAKKYGCTESNVYIRTRGSKNGHKPSPAVVERAKKLTKPTYHARAAKVADPGTDHYAASIEHLRERREILNGEVAKLNVAIEAMEELIG